MFKIQTIFQIYFMAKLTLPLNHDFTEPVIFHTRSDSGMVNKMNLIPTLFTTGKCPRIHHQHMSVKLNCISKYFIQNNLEVKNNPHSLVSPTRTFCQGWLASV